MRGAATCADASPRTEYSSPRPSQPAVQPQMRASASMTNFLSFVDVDDVKPLTTPTPPSSSHMSCPELSICASPGDASHAAPPNTVAAPAADRPPPPGAARPDLAVRTPVIRVQLNRAAGSPVTWSPLKFRVPSPASASQVAATDTLTGVPSAGAPDATGPATAEDSPGAVGGVTPRDTNPAMPPCAADSAATCCSNAAATSALSSSGLTPAVAAAAASVHVTQRPLPSATSAAAVDAAAAAAASAMQAAPAVACCPVAVGQAAPPSGHSPGGPVMRQQKDELVTAGHAAAADAMAIWKACSSDLDDEVWATAVSTILPDGRDEASTSPSTVALEAAASGGAASAAISAEIHAATAVAGGKQGDAVAGSDPSALVAQAQQMSVDAAPRVSVDTSSSPLPISRAAQVVSGAVSAPSEPASTTPSAALDCFMRMPCPDTSPTPSYTAITPPSTIVSDSSIAFPALPAPRNAAAAAAVRAATPAAPPSPASPTSDSSTNGAEVSFVYAAFPDLRSSGAVEGAPGTASSTAPPAPASAPLPGQASPSRSQPDSASPARAALSRQARRVGSSSSLRRSAQEVLVAIRRTFSRRRSGDLPAVEPDPAPFPRPQSQFFKEVQDSIFSLEDEESTPRRGEHPGGEQPLGPQERSRDASQPLSQPTSATSMQGLMPPSPGALLSSQLSTSNSEGLTHCGSDASAPAAPAAPAAAAARLAPIQSSSSLQQSPRGRPVPGRSHSESSRRSRSEGPARMQLSRRSARLSRLSACFCVPEQ